MTQTKHIWEELPAPVGQWRARCCLCGATTNNAALASMYPYCPPPTVDIKPAPPVVDTTLEDRAEQLEAAATAALAGLCVRVTLVAFAILCVATILAGMGYLFFLFVRQLSQGW